MEIGTQSHEIAGLRKTKSFPKHSSTNCLCKMMSKNKCNHGFFFDYFGLSYDFSLNSIATVCGIWL